MDSENIKSYPVKITAMRFDWFFDKEKQKTGCKACIRRTCGPEKLHTTSLSFLRHILSQENMNLYENDTIIIIVEFMFNQYKRVLFSY